jgi:hypothetical protein
MMLMVSTEEASVSTCFDLTSFAEERYKWREVSEHRNFGQHHDSYETVATIFKLKLR